MAVLRSSAPPTEIPGQRLTGLRSTLSTSLSCSASTTCVAVGVASGGGATSLTTTDFSTWQPTASIPSGSQLSSIVLPESRRPASPSARTSVRPPTSSAPRTTGRHGHSRARRANAVDLTGISCSDSEDCVAVGNTGNLGAGSTIMGTTTGGLSWTAQTPPPGTSQLSSVSCPTTVDCFAVGVNSVLASVNGATHGARSRFPPTSPASTPFRVRRHPTARRWGSASSGAPSSSGRRCGSDLDL